MVDGWIEIMQPLIDTKTAIEYQHIGIGGKKSHYLSEKSLIL